jgi:hypothetical protein
MVKKIERAGWIRAGVAVSFLGAIGLLLAACSSASSPAAKLTPAATATKAATIAPAASGPEAFVPMAEYSGIIASSEFIVGQNRFPFGLVSEDGQLLEHAQVNVRFYYLKQDSSELRAEAPAIFREVRGVTPHPHPDGEVHEHLEVRGAYTVSQVEFDTPGFWGAEFVVKTADGRQPKIQGRAFEVKSQSAVPNIGDRVPPSMNLTLADVDNIEQIETRVPPDNMHRLSVAQALERGKPFVVVFATPMFCVTRMCGPVTDITASLHDRYKEQVNFIHIEPWDLRIARGEGRLVAISVVLEWKLPTEPWVFVVDEAGRVAARFEGLVSSEELEAAILAVLRS